MRNGATILKSKKFQRFNVIDRGNFQKVQLK